jgi:crotonobetainyl-CoA:carnitine CoA-transferase CaiB-like acyl-CoA transferase
MIGGEPEVHDGVRYPKVNSISDTAVWSEGEGVAGPLAGVKVLDLSRVLAGPYATMLMADLGADVIKVESPAGVATRGGGPPFVEDTAVYYLTANRGKRSVVLDLTTGEGQAAALALASAADVLVENFRPGGARRFGLAYENVRAVNPRCVYCSITGFGTGSEREHDPTYDLVVQAAGGIMGITGVDGEPPVKVGVATADLMAGLYAVTATLSALLERERTEAGRHVEISLMDAQVASLGNQALNWLAAGLNPGRLGSDHPNVVPYGAFLTGSDYIVVAVGNDAQFGRLAAAVDRTEWAADARFSTNGARVANREALRVALEAILCTRPADAWLEALRAAGVPCGPVRDVAAVFADPEVRERMVRSIPHPRLGSVPQVLSPFRFDGAPAAALRHPPELGEHTDEVLADLEDRRA